MAFDQNNKFKPVTTTKPGKPSGEQPGSGYTWGGGRTDTNTFTSPDVSKQNNRAPHLPSNPWHGIPPRINATSIAKVASYPGNKGTKGTASVGTSMSPTKPSSKPVSGSAPTSITSKIK